MKHTLFPLFAAMMAAMILADVGPSGCGRRPGPPAPKPDTPPPSDAPAPTTAPAPGNDIPSPPAY